MKAQKIVDQHMGRNHEFYHKGMQGVGALIDTSRIRWFSFRLLIHKVDVPCMCVVGHKWGFWFEQR